MKEKELHTLAVHLCEGDIVHFNGHFIMAKEVPYENPCNECQMDSICDMAMTDLCAECDGYTHTKHYLQLANKRVVNFLT